MNYSRLIISGLLLSLASLINAQQVTKGVVRWEDDKPSVGATVTVKGSTVSTLTDADGEYEIQTRPGDVLEIIVPYYKIHYTYSAHRLSVWGDLGLSIPENKAIRTYASSNSGNYYHTITTFLFGYEPLTGAYSLPGGSIGVAYQHIVEYFLFTVGLELQSLNSYLCYNVDEKNPSSWDNNAYRQSLDNFIPYNQFENHIYAQIPVMLGFEVPFFYFQAGMKVGTALYNGSVPENKKYDWQCIRWGPTAELGVSIDKGASVTRAQKAQKGKAEYPGKAMNYKIGLVYDFGINHTVKTHSDGSYYLPFSSTDMFLGVKFTASFQSEIKRKERRWR